MSLAEEILAAVPEEERQDVIDAAIAACEATVRRALAARMSSWSPARLSAYAAERGAQCVLTKDPTMPGGVRFDFVPTHVPAFLAPERTQ